MKQDYRLRKTIHMLSNNSRVSTKEVSKEIKTSQQNASYLINKLDHDKIIHSFKLLVDSSKFGMNNFCVFLRLKNYSKSQIKLFVSGLKKYKEIVAIDLLFGKYDIFIKFVAPNPSQFNKILNEILNNNSETIFDFLILTQIVLYYYPSNYLSKKRFERKIIISGDRDYVPITEDDKKIIELLNENSRTNFSTIANKIGTTSKTIISRVKNLEKKGIIKGYSININHKKLNISKYYLFLKFDFTFNEENKKFVKFTKNCPNIIEFIKVFGEWNAILLIESQSIDDFKKILFTIKEEFSENIVDYDFVESEEIKIWKYF